MSQMARAYYIVRSELKRSYVYEIEKHDNGYTFITATPATKTGLKDGRRRTRAICTLMHGASEEDIAMEFEKLLNG